MKILVTGGAGFIGSAFIRFLVGKKDYKIVVIDKLTYAGDLKRLEIVFDKIMFYKCDLLNQEFMDYIFQKERPKIIVHFASETHVDRSILDPFKFLKTNIEGTNILLWLSVKYGVERFINISTEEVYGEIVEGEFNENSSLSPNSPYSVSKAAQDMLARAYYRTYGLPVITVRPCNNYGPWQYPEKLIPAAILKILRNEPVPLYGDGNNVREWLFVEDCAEAIYKIVENGKIGEIYNVGSGIEKKNIEVVQLILKLLNKPEDFIIFVKDRPGHDRRYFLNSNKIKRELNWTPKTSFEEGLEKTVRWYLENKVWLFEKFKELKPLWEKVYK